VSECLHHEDGDGDCIHHACANCYREIYDELLPLRAENERLRGLFRQIRDTVRSPQEIAAEALAPEKGETNE
jgi:hypothetical protein